ncbi:ADP-ribosylation factor-related protein [Tieghemostelium lacteum]|uniref:ADP-ribosylation factor-related protein n=1 Tax=Tieghemostelium lacteum TaxID=361077 RepID=A0A152AA76_TIELA|nr:ADP-ribosylation factor-related protein [Tieghemostelium lacteum]|eukprot:KYR03104.1 ADP-ribosylation factor-related protein [Tieghemostelium lacteum]
MGSLLSIFQKKTVPILFLGLENAGKTTLLHKLKYGEFKNDITATENGFNCESIVYDNKEWFIVDIGGNRNNRILYYHYIENAKAIVIVIDSTDRNRINELKSELSAIQQRVSSSDNRRPFLILLANKQDLTDAMSIDELTSQLEINSVLSTRNWIIRPISILNGNGVDEIFQILSTNIIL